MLRIRFSSFSLFEIDLLLYYLQIRGKSNKICWTPSEMINLTRKSVSLSNFTNFSTNKMFLCRIPATLHTCTPDIICTDILNMIEISAIACVPEFHWAKSKELERMSISLLIYRSQKRIQDLVKSPRKKILRFCWHTKWSFASEASQYWLGSRACLRTLEALAFLTIKYICILPLFLVLYFLKNFQLTCDKVQ